MDLIQLDGIVTKEINVKENDKIIIIYSKELGKVSLYAKNAKKIKSELLSGTQLFCYSKFWVYMKSNIYYINQLQIIEPFYNLKNSIYKLSYSMYIVELLNEFSMEEIKNEHILKLTLNTIYFISKHDENISINNYKVLKTIYELKMLDFSGYSPEVMNCVCCGKQVIGECDKISISLGGVLCHDCAYSDENSKKITKNSLYVLKYILHSDLKEVFKFDVDEKILNELSDIIQLFLQEILIKKLKTLEFLKLLQ